VPVRRRALVPAVRPQELVPARVRRVPRRRELGARQPELGVQQLVVPRPVQPVRLQLVRRRREPERRELGRLRQQPVGPVGSGPPAERPVAPCGRARAVRSGGC
jgi:hypothetical protein